MLRGDLSKDNYGKKVSLETFDALIDPQMKIPKSATKIHGIRDKDVYGGETFKSIAADLVLFSKGCPIIAHNCRFDLSFIKSEFARIGMKFPMKNEFYCTMLRFRSLLRSIKSDTVSASLESACEYFEIPFSRGQYHIARDDAVATFQLAAGLAEIDRKYGF